MANLVVFLLTILPLVVAAQLPRTIEPILISGTGDKVCTTSLDQVLEQQKSEKKHLVNEISSILSLNYFFIDQCGDGLWYKLVSINMSDPLNQCPPSWVEENVDEVRACGRGTIDAGCLSTTFNTGELQYRKVCGRAIGYQYGNTDAFAVSGTINQVYVDGLSITYGAPRQHIWTYAAAVSEVPINADRYTTSNCPCASEPGASPSSFLGNNWYCESGNPDPVNPAGPKFLSNDPLWDGKNCEGTCCGNGKSPPWFSVELPGPTNDIIEARLCANEHSDNHKDVFIKIFEVYIQ